MSLLSWVRSNPQRPSEQDVSPPPDPRDQKLLPLIDRDSCIGCERCVAACEHACLEMIWSFATLTNGDTCTGEGRCTEACPQEIIRMEWLSVEKPRAQS